MESGSLAGFCVPRDEVAAHHLVRQTALAVEANADGVAAREVGRFEDELVQQIVILRRQSQFLDGLAVERDFHRAAHVGRAFFGGQQQRPQRHDGGLRGAPGAGGVLLRRRYRRAPCVAVPEASPHLSSACTARPVVSTPALSPPP